MFGLTNSDGNHGEDVKEYYFYLDSTPTHSYVKFLYKYPQAAFPRNDVVIHHVEPVTVPFKILGTGCPRSSNGSTRPAKSIWDTFKVECPTGPGRVMNLFGVAKDIADRLVRIFMRNEHGRRPVFGGTARFQSDPHWRDHVLFYEYFHGDNGAGLGASHQTGWTGCVAQMIE